MDYLLRYPKTSVEGSALQQPSEDSGGSASGRSVLPPLSYVFEESESALLGDAFLNDISSILDNCLEQNPPQNDSNQKNSVEAKLDDLVVNLRGDETEEECSRRYREYRKRIQQIYKERHRTRTTHPGGPRRKKREFHPLILNCSAYKAGLSTPRSKASRLAKKLAGKSGEFTNDKKSFKKLRKDLESSQKKIKLLQEKVEKEQQHMNKLQQELWRLAAEQPQ